MCIHTITQYLPNNHTLTVFFLHFWRAIIFPDMSLSYAVAATPCLATPNKSTQQHIGCTCVTFKEDHADDDDHHHPCCKQHNNIR